MIVTPGACKAIFISRLVISTPSSRVSKAYEFNSERVSVSTILKRYAHTQHVKFVWLPVSQMLVHLPGIRYVDLVSDLDLDL